MILKDKINNLKYTTEEDIHIFLAILQNLLDKLERVDTDISDSSKLEYWIGLYLKIYVGSMFSYSIIIGKHVVNTWKE